MSILNLTGTVRGKKTLYVRLDDQSSREIGKAELRSVVTNRILSENGYNQGDAVIAMVELTDGGFLKVREISPISNDTGIQPETNQPETQSSAVNPIFGRIPDGIMRIPTNRPNLYLDDSTKTMVKAIMQMVESGIATNVRLTGPQGTGKTSLAEKIAEKLGYNFVSFDCGGISEPEDWICRKTLETDSHGNQILKVYPTSFSYGITTPNTVLLLDEFNRVDSRIHNAIYSLLDERGTKYSDDMQATLSRAENVLIMATMNQELSNVGTFELDSAIKDRFPYEIELGLLAEPILTIMLRDSHNLDEKYASLLAQIAHSIENLNGTTISHGVGHRPLIACSKLLNIGLDWENATTATILRHFDKSGGVESERAKVATIINGFGQID